MIEEKDGEKGEEDKLDLQPLSDEASFEHPSFKYVPNGHHDWKQQGYYLICKSCGLELAIWIGSKYLLVGIREDGMPIVKTRKSLGFL